ncbi:hypothetical protein RB2150_15401 [Rhodobacteraceae bacterium HTCC2150]|nr:hypothetical protein RB2150_15401 [Rhodobacteraceae bacterium HTCC2150]
MSHSRNEVSALITKAGVGAGLPWALAQDLALAFISIEMPSIEDWRSLDVALSNQLNPLSATSETQYLEILNAQIVTAGPATTDWLGADFGRVTLHDLDAPNLLVGYLTVGSVEHGLAYKCTAEGNQIKVSAQELSLTRNPSSLARLEIPHEILESLHAFAANTYVPESEASRLSGAGAGLTDND